MSSIPIEVKEGCEKWRVFKFADMKQTLQSRCNEVANMQEESETSRKKLIDMSREFKRTTDESVRNQVSPLMKYFQKEIDSLLHRSKTGESCLLELLQNFVPLPAPDKLFYALFNTVDSLKEETNSRDKTISKLSEEIGKLEDLQSEHFALKLREKEEILRLQVEENEQILRNQISTKSDEISHLKTTIQRMQESHQNSEKEIIDLRNKHEQELTARGQETDLLLNDQEKLQMQLQNTLAKSDASFEQTFQPQTSKIVPQLEQELISKENEIEALNRKIFEIEQKSSETDRNHLTELASNKTELESVKNRIIELETVLREQSDYNEVKEELATLKLIEFGSTTKESEGQKSAESLLVNKNKQLQTQCTKLRTENEQLHLKAQDLEHSLSSANAKTNKNEAEIEHLEQDILRLQKLLPTLPDVEGFPSSISTTSASNSNEFLLEVVHNQQTQQGTPTDSGLVSILISQRERLKEKHLALQHDFDTVKHQSNELQVRISTLENDNMRLYEKIRFLQAYPTSNVSQFSHDKTFQRYSHDYESKLDPFTAFNRREIFTRYSRMPGTDRAIFNIGKVILSNRITRRLTLFYLLLIHVLLMFGIYFYTHYETCKMDAYTNCLRSFEDHMQVHHAQD